MHILFTKSQNSSEILIKRFSDKGHRITNFSILNIKPIIIPDINFKDFTAVIFTSSNAVQNLKNIKNVSHLKCFCVGEETAAAAKRIGFLNIQVAGGNYIELRDLIFKSCDKAKENFIYVRGEFISNDLEGDFKKQGYNLKSVINYTAEPNLNIDHQLIEDLKNKLIDVIFVYSKRAADQLLKIILNHKIMDDLDNCSLNCISINVANTLKRLKWKRIKIFSPGEEELSLL
ncbi:MAG: uroporphyrinogen-III synthase [Pseudomonadota bacterium]